MIPCVRLPHGVKCFIGLFKTFQLYHSHNAWEWECFPKVFPDFVRERLLGSVDARIFLARRLNYFSDLFHVRCFEYAPPFRIYSNKEELIITIFVLINESSAVSWWLCVPISISCRVIGRKVLEAVLPFCVPRSAALYAKSPLPPTSAPFAFVTKDCSFWKNKKPAEIFAS